LGLHPLCSQARQDPGALRRPGAATAGLNRHGRTQRAARPRAHRRHGLYLRPRERCNNHARGGLLRARQTRMAAAT